MDRAKVQSRRWLGAALFAGMLAGCSQSPNAKIENAVADAAEDLALPDKPQFAPLGTQILRDLASDVPGLAEQLPALEQAERARMAALGTMLQGMAPLLPPPAGKSPAPGTAALVPDRPGARFDLAGWLVSPARAQGVDGAKAATMQSGFAAGLLLGEVVGAGSGGKTDHAERSLEHESKELASIAVDAAADGTLSTTLSSNVDVAILGAQAGSKTTVISKSLCPDTNGVVEFTIRVEQTAAGPGGAARNVRQEAQVTVTVNDNGEIESRTIRTDYERGAGGKGGASSLAGKANWRVGRGTDPALESYQLGQTTGSGAAMEVDAAMEAFVLGLAAVDGAAKYWEGGKCIAIKADPPYRPAPGQRTPIPVAVTHKQDGSPVPARVDAKLTGGASLDPVVIRRAPGSLEHVAPNQRNVGMTLELTARSRRGKATERYTFTTYKEQAYRIQGGGHDPVDQVLCSISEPAVLNGKLFGVEITGGYEGTWKIVRTPSPLVKWSAGGDYRIEFPNGEDKPGTLRMTGSGTTAAGGVSRTNAADEVFTLTPVDPC